MLEHFTVITGY